MGSLCSPRDVLLVAYGKGLSAYHGVCPSRLSSGRAAAAMSRWAGFRKSPLRSPSGTFQRRDRGALCSGPSGNSTLLLCRARRLGAPALRPPSGAR